MNEVIENGFNDLANEYQSKKQKTLLNLLYCGKILYDAKVNLKHGSWLIFIKDVRVSESERTAQRLISIFKNYRHLLDEDIFNKTDALTQLGVSHLLELQKLPDRFKKEIQIIHEKDGEKIEEIVQVIDEDKLSDFLEQQVEFEGANKHIRDLPLTEMKKYIKEAQGIFEPEDPYGPEERVSAPVEDSSSEDVHVQPISKGDVSKAITGLTSLIQSSNDTLSLIKKIDLTEIAITSQDEMDELKVKLKQTISILTTVVVTCEDVKDRF